MFEGDNPIRLGSRALDILIALVEHAGELVGKDDLVARVWPGTFVEEGNLEFEVAALRRALGGGNRYLVNVPGRGYSFVAPVAIAEGPRQAPPEAVAATKREHNLPALSADDRSRRYRPYAHEATARPAFDHAVGPGGVGKTTLAVAVADRQIEGYEHGVWLVDLSPVSDPRLVPTALAACLGWKSARATHSGIDAALRDKRMLLVLDNCEHVSMLPLAWRSRS